MPPTATYNKQTRVQCTWCDPGTPLPSSSQQEQKEPYSKPWSEFYYPLNRSPEQIFYYIRDSSLLHLPKPMKV